MNTSEVHTFILSSAEATGPCCLQHQHNPAQIHDHKEDIISHAVHYEKIQLHSLTTTLKSSWILHKHMLLYRVWI